jgi:hypothetical protein
MRLLIDVGLGQRHAAQVWHEGCAGPACKRVEQQVSLAQGIIEAVTKSYAKVRFVDDSVVKNMNLFNEFERSKRLSNFLEEGKAWRWLDTG